MDGDGMSGDGDNDERDRTNDDMDETNDDIQSCVEKDNDENGQHVMTEEPARFQHDAVRKGFYGEEDELKEWRLCTMV